MSSFIVRRLVQLVPVLLVMCIVVFSTTLMLPGDPTASMLGEHATAKERAELRSELGLDQPVVVQFAKWLGRAATGDLGRSLKTREPVAQMLAARIPVTFELTLLAVALSLVIGVPLGILAALKRNSWIDTAVSAVAMSSMAIPYFWVGILLIMFFSIRLGWLPPSGYVPFHVDPLANLKLMLMPAITIGTAQAALVMRQTRAAMLGVLLQDFIRTARAKGAGERRVIVRHALRNAMMPVVTVIGLQMGALIGGAVVTETVFSLPGLGRMIVDGIFERDFPVVQGAILVVVVGVLVINILTDLSYALLDKRVQL
ncbi:MAG: ABC transporter permease [Chelatococcus sp.]|jgi:peptide/nickel transport system permease protein|uniref:ABC transporter permease n=1 Tax=unclassified Chelatococcus TaxID=2638111 RepID=UPI001BCFB390|nr:MULTISPECIES: ABC transporter permease [unclassified Chelatococcus]CAH1670144.1 dipeptide ABC transporter membrane subunit DppB [Hyphomicrobiales bacterium]MBS7739243.1 ABC transporter permease [Chelatococcus sp. HY11]MBX3540560.1 ABC transporter permease [Chelatococcus sp.]MBX3546522.1 ABC transporter permease [Chelatococcus sp.]MCO5076224.1 ABC transporter permease [Chelatococcus sp.]